MNDFFYQKVDGIYFDQLIRSYQLPSKNYISIGYHKSHWAEDIWNNLETTLYIARVPVNVIVKVRETVSQGKIQVFLKLIWMFSFINKILMFVIF